VAANVNIDGDILGNGFCEEAPQVAASDVASDEIEAVQARRHGGGHGGGVDGGGDGGNMLQLQNIGDGTIQSFHSAVEKKNI